MKRTQLSGKNHSTIINALHVARAVYENDAKQTTQGGHHRLGEQFQQQAIDVSNLIDWIENSDVILAEGE